MTWFRLEIPAIGGQIADRSRGGAARIGGSGNRPTPWRAEGAHTWLLGEFLQCGSVPKPPAQAGPTREWLVAAIGNSTLLNSAAGRSMLPGKSPPCTAP